MFPQAADQLRLAGEQSRQLRQQRLRRRILGLDNITVLDRSEKLPNGVVLEQSDATGWMGMFCLNLMRIALELSYDNKAYESLATKFFQHYIYVGAAMKKMGGKKYSLWDDKEYFLPP